MIIEFIGLPGSGKTTTEKELMLHLEHIGYVCVEPTKNKTIYRYLDYLRFDNLKLRYLIFLYSMKYIHFRNFIYFSNWFLDYYNYYKAKSTASCNTIILSEQGLLQLLISIPFTQRIINKIVLKEIVRYINKKCVSFSIVYCSSDIVTVYDRIRKRSICGRRIDSMDETSMVSALRIQEKNFSLLYECLKDEYSSVLLLDSKESLPQKVKNIIDYFCISTPNRRA